MKVFRVNIFISNIIYILFVGGDGRLSVAHFSLIFKYYLRMISNSFIIFRQA